MYDAESDLDYFGDNYDSEDDFDGADYRSDVEETAATLGAFAILDTLAAERAAEGEAA